MARPCESLRTARRIEAGSVGTQRQVWACRFHLTEQDCDAAGGHFLPQVFGWMVHVYPFEQKPEDVWSVERQMHNHAD